MSTRDFSWGKDGRCVRVRPTTPVVMNVKKIRGLNLPGTPWACPGLLRENFTFTYVILYLLGLDIFLRIKSRTLLVSVRSSLIVGDQMRLTAYFHKVSGWRVSGTVSPLFMQGQPYAFLLVMCRITLNLSVMAWRFRIVAVIFVIVDLQYCIIL